MRRDVNTNAILDSLIAPLHAPKHQHQECDHPKQIHHAQANREDKMENDPCGEKRDRDDDEKPVHTLEYRVSADREFLFNATSVQDATAAVNVEFHRHFDRARASGLKLPLQKSFRGQFVQVRVAGAFHNFDFIHVAAPGIYR